MMGIVVKQKEFELPVEGLHTAVISRIEDLGIVETANDKKDRKTRHASSSQSLTRRLSTTLTLKFSSQSTKSWMEKAMSANY
jgi:hypothetical protein